MFGEIYLITMTWKLFSKIYILDDCLIRIVFFPKFNVNSTLNKHLVFACLLIMPLYAVGQDEKGDELLLPRCCRKPDATHTLKLVIAGLATLKGSQTPKPPVV